MLAGCGAEPGPESDEGDDVGQANQALWRGEHVHDTRVAQIASPQGTCTAIPIGTMLGAAMLLTAAHCVDDISSPTTMTISRSTSPGVTQALGNFQVNFAIHPDYSEGASGGTLARNDIAVLWAPFLPNNSFNFSPIFTGTIGTSSVMEAFGFGSHSQYSYTGGTLRTGYQFGNFRPDWVGEKHFYDNNDGHVSTCDGDSGGPTRLTTGTHPVTGVLSNSGGGAICRTDLETHQHWVKVSAKLSWIEGLRGTCRSGSMANTKECW